MIYSGNGGSTAGTLEDLPKTVATTTSFLRKHLDKFDYIAVTGLSGILVGAPVALKLKVPLVVVRKPNESSHQWSTPSADGAGVRVGKNPNMSRFIFLDDFISSGATRSYVVESLPEDEIVGTVLYHGEWDKGFTSKYLTAEWV